MSSKATICAAFRGEFADDGAVPAHHSGDRAGRVVVERGDLREVVGEGEQDAAGSAKHGRRDKQRRNAEETAPAPPVGKSGHAISLLRLRLHEHAAWLANRFRRREPTAGEAARWLRLGRRLARAPPTAEVRTAEVRPAGARRDRARDSVGVPARCVMARYVPARCVMVAQTGAARRCRIEARIRVAPHDPEHRLARARVPCVARARMGVPAESNRLPAVREPIPKLPIRTVRSAVRSGCLPCPRSRADRHQLCADGVRRGTARASSPDVIARSGTLARGTSTAGSCVPGISGRPTPATLERWGAARWMSAAG